MKKVKYRCLVDKFSRRIIDFAGITYQLSVLIECPWEISPGSQNNELMFRFYRKFIFPHFKGCNRLLFTLKIHKCLFYLSPSLTFAYSFAYSLFLVYSIMVCL